MSEERTYFENYSIEELAQMERVWWPMLVLHETLPVKLRARTVGPNMFDSLQREMRNRTVASLNVREVL